MSATGNGNGNGEAKVQKSPLEVASEQLSAVSSDAPPATDAEEDVLRAWAQRKNVSLSDLRDGLVAMSTFAEAALESNIRNAAEIRKLTSAVNTLADRAEDQSNEFVSLKKELHQLKIGVYDLKVDAEDLRKKVQLLPAMKQMLGDILARLPE